MSHMSHRFHRGALAAALLAVAAGAAADAFAVREESGGRWINLAYVGTPYPIPGHTWWSVAPQPIPPVDHRIYALDLLPSLAVPADPVPAPDVLVRGALQTQRTAVVWLDTDTSGDPQDGIDDLPEQTEAAILSLERLARTACQRRIGHAWDCADMGSLAARAADGEVLADGEADMIEACIQESRTCGSPNAGNRVRLLGLVRAAYASRDTQSPAPVPDLDTGWSDLPSQTEQSE